MMEGSTIANLQRKDFDADMVQLWITLSDKRLECKICSGAKKKGRSVTKDAELVFCNGTCQREVPEYHTL